MRFYPRKAPRKKADILVEKVASGKCDDLVVSELKVAIGEVTELEEVQRISWSILDIVMNSANLVAVGYSLKAFMIFLPTAEDVESALDSRVLTLVEDKNAIANKVLLEAIAGYARERINGSVDRAEPFIPALLLFLEECACPAGAISFEVLMNVAAARPEFFEPHTTLLTRELGSINNATRVYTARIITRLASSHPEFVAETEKTLLHLSTFYPDAEVKSAAAEAYQTIKKSHAQQQPESASAPRPTQDTTGGLADIMRKKASTRDKKPAGESRIDNRLLSLAANFARKSDLRNGQPRDSTGATAGDHHADSDNEAMDKIIDDFSEIAGVITADHPVAPRPRQASPEEERISKEEAELREMVAKVKMDFSESAESLLDSLGMGHLAKDQKAETRGEPLPPSPKPAGNLLDSLGVGHLAKDQRAERVAARAVPPAEPEPLPEPVQAEISAITLAPDNSSVVTSDEYHEEFIASIEQIITEADEKGQAELAAPARDLRAEAVLDKSPVAEPVQPVVVVPEPVVKPVEEPVVVVPEPVVKPVEEPVVVVPEPVVKPVEEPVVVAPEPVAPSVEVPEALPQEQKPEQSVTSQPNTPEEPASGEAKVGVTDRAKEVKSPIIPAGVRISAVKFKAIDQTKKQASATVSIKPHIKPLNRTPRDVSKLTAQRASQQASPAQPASGQPPAPKPAAEPVEPQAVPPVKEEVVSSEPVPCPTCGEKLAPDAQYCGKCGTDLKSEKVRCVRCSQINTRESSTCVRCGAKLFKAPVKQPETPT